MGILRRLDTALNVLFRSGNDPIAFSSFQDFSNWFSETQKTSSGFNVTPEAGSRISTVFACLNVLSQDIGVMPAHVKQWTDKGSITLQNDPVHRLLHYQPNPYMNAYQFKYAMTFIGEYIGNSYAYIERNARYEPVNLWLLDPYKVSMQEYGLQWKYLVNGVEFEAHEIFHYRTFTKNGVEGISKIQYNAELIGIKLTQQNYKSKSLSSQPPGFFTGQVTTEQKKDIITSWSEGAKTRSTPFLMGAVDYKQLMASAKESDIVNSEKWTDTQTLAIWRMQPTMLSNHGDSNYSNAEQQDLSHVKYTLAAPIAAWEQEVNNKLFTESNKQSNTPKYFKFNVNSLLRGDMRAQAEWVRTMVTLGIYNADEVLDLQDLPHQPNDLGKKYIVQGAFIDKEFLPNQPPAPQQTARAGFEVPQEIKDFPVFENKTK